MSYVIINAFIHSSPLSRVTPIPAEHTLARNLGNTWVMLPGQHRANTERHKQTPVHTCWQCPMMKQQQSTVQRSGLGIKLVTAVTPNPIMQQNMTFISSFILRQNTN